jgi:large subunit ribosomal protein L6
MHRQLMGGRAAVDHAGEQSMSRVGKKPIAIPAHTQITYRDRGLTIQGQKGKLTRQIHPAVDLMIADGVVQVQLAMETKTSRALQGLTRSLVANMLMGVSQGFERVLEINGIGYRAEVKGKTLVFQLGYSTPKEYELPERVSASVEKNTIIKLSGIDKEELGRVAAAIRRLRPPEPYKGKGIKYAEERIQKKAGKTGTK